jgi:predicted ribosomally synthesized peptide with nif11-like leader
MSQENALNFLKQVADSPELSSQVMDADHKEEVVDLAKENGFVFSEDDMKSVIPKIHEKPGFFGELAQAVIALFAPAHDDYPATGVQPFTGELNRKH